jgi:hypothetical protein
MSMYVLLCVCMVCVGCVVCGVWCGVWCVVRGVWCVVCVRLWWVGFFFFFGERFYVLFSDRQLQPQRFLESSVPCPESTRYHMT